MTGILAFLNIAVVQSLTVAETPPSVSGYGAGGTTADIGTGLVFATAAGGVPPYTYAWSQITTSPYTWDIDTPASASTKFVCNSLDAGTTTQATFRVTATDASGTTATANVTAYANNGQPYDPEVRATTTRISKVDGALV